MEQASKHHVLPSSAPNEGMEPTASSLRCTPAPVVTTLVKDATITPDFSTGWRHPLHIQCSCRTTHAKHLC